VGNAVATLDGKGTNVTVAEPRSLAGLLDLDVRHGSIAALGTNGIAVSQTRADKNDWHVGSTVRLGFSDRSIISLRVGAIYKQTDLVGPVLVPRVVYTPHAVQATDSMVLVDVRSGVSIGTAKAAIKRAVHPYGDPDVQDRKEFIASAASGADLFLGIVYVMLALAIVIALMGIANTMSLAVHERGREIGLLRAVGQTRSQVRAMVRGESVIVAMFGTLTGVAMGVFLAWAVLRAGSSNGLNVFSAPLSNLGLVFAIGTIAGLFASVRPARRAARVPVMTALVSP
jgi:putative ABC transport system permease protein